MDSVKQKDEGVSIHSRWINNLRFADDIDVIEENEQRLERTVQILNEDGKRYGLQMNLQMNLVWWKIYCKQDHCRRY